MKRFAIVILSLLSVFEAWAQIHFTPAFIGNGVDHMNIRILSATLDGVSLSQGDEIAVFDDTICCGVVVLTQPINPVDPSSFGLIAASKADIGKSNGYTAGHTIGFKIWDSSAMREHSSITPTFKSPVDGLPISALPYLEGGSAFVSLSAIAQAIDRLKLDDGMRIYPNPVADVLYLDNTGKGYQTYVLMDIHGKSLKSGRLSEGLTILPLDKNAPALLILKLSGDDKNCVVKLLHYLK